MAIDGTALAAILGMAFVTYAVRAGGVWLMGRARPSGRVQAGLQHVPGAVLTALIAPALLEAGIAGLLAALGTVLIARRTGNLLLAVAAGVAATWALRHLM